mgnify:CR=1 FL=1
MANETSFDILSQFSPPGLENLTLSTPTTGSTLTNFIPTYSGGNITVTEPKGEPNQTQLIDPGEQFNLDAQRQINIMSDYYAGTYLPTLELKQQNIDDAKEQLGFGRRYSADDFKAQFRRELGQIPKTKSTEKAFRLLYDILTKKSDYRGAGAVMDILLQSGGAYMNREQAEKAQRLKQTMLVNEMAIKQANEMNQIMLGKEAELTLKGMGYNEETLQTMLNFNTNTQSKFIQEEIDRISAIQESDLTKDEKLFQMQIDKSLKREQLDIDQSKALFDHSLLMLRNPDKAFPNLMYTIDGGKTMQSVPVQLKSNPIDGSPMYQLGRMVELKDGSEVMVYDQNVPKDWDVRGIYSGDALGTEMKAMSGGFGSKALSEIGGSYFVLTQAVDEMSEILAENQESIDAGQGPTFGTAGFLKGKFQEAKFIGADIMNMMFGTNTKASTLGTVLETLGQKEYQGDIANFRLLNQGAEINPELVPDFDSSMPITYEVPGKGLTSSLTGGTLGSKTTTLDTSLSNMFDQTFYTRMGYKGVYARNKVRENYLVYAIARSLKSSGRLNVNDVETARQMLTITSAFQSAAGVETKVREIQSILDQAARNTVAKTFLSGTSILEQNPALKEDYIRRYGEPIFEGQEPTTLTPPPNSNDSSVGDGGSIYVDPDIPEFDINNIGGSN